MMRVVLIIVVALLAGAGGYFAYSVTRGAPEGQVAAATDARSVSGDPIVGQPRPDYTLGSVDGSRVSASDFDGKVVLVNFWATWCAPCREEMPMLMELREQHAAQGLEVVGIAMDDVQRARDFVAELGIEYPNLVGATDVMAAMQLYGNASGTLPYSVLVNRAGEIAWVKLGILERPELEGEISALLAEN